MTGPEQHAATVREALDQERHIPTGVRVRDPYDALDELVALAGRADELDRRLRDAPLGGDGSHWVDCWRSHIDCAVHRVEAAEARADELQRERDEWQHVARETADNLHAAIKRREAQTEQARREADQLRAALRFYADENNWTQPTSWGGRIHDDESLAIRDGGKHARSALAGVQADTFNPHHAMSPIKHVQADNKDSA